MKTLILLFFIFLSCSIFGQEVSLNGILPTAPLNENGEMFQIETKLPRGGKIWALDWSPNGKWLAIGNRTGHIRIYETEGYELVRILTGFDQTINGISWSPDNSKVAASGFDPRVIVWDLKNGTQQILNEHKAQVRGVQWSPCGKYLASTSHDGRILIWNENGDIVKTFSGAGGGCVDIDWLDNNIIAGACWDNTMRIYQMNDTSMIVADNGARGTKAVLSVDWHPSGQFLATGDYGNSSDPDHNVRFWTAGGALIKEMKDHTMEIRSLKWSPSGDLLTSGGEAVRIWDQSGNLLHSSHSEMEPIWAIDWDDKGERIASGHNNGKVMIWDREGKEVARIDGHSSEIISYQYSPDSTLLVVGLANGEMRLLDLVRLHSLSEKINVRSIQDIDWHPNRKIFAIGSNDSEGSIWKTNGKKLKLIEKLTGHTSNITDVSWRSDGKRLATVANEPRILIWDKKGTLVEEIVTDKDRNVHVIWENNRPITNDEEMDFLETTLPVKINDISYTYVPLIDNGFALFDKKGHLYQGDKSFFVTLVAKEGGTVDIRALE